jgi:dihydroorotase
VTELVEPGILDLPLVIERMATTPARLFDLRGGSLTVGAAADITVFDPSRGFVVDPSRFLSKGRNTPYAGRSLRGQALFTIVGGRVVHRLVE